MRLSWRMTALVEMSLQGDRKGRRGLGSAFT